MAREAFSPTSEQLCSSLVKQAKDWVKQQAKSIEYNFPTLKDGTVGLQIGYSMSELYAKVLRPDGRLYYADLAHVGPAKRNDMPLAPSQYLSFDTLEEIQMAVNQVKLTLRKERRPSPISGIRSIFTKS